MPPLPENIALKMHTYSKVTDEPLDILAKLNSPKSHYNSLKYDNHMRQFTNT